MLRHANVDALARSLTAKQFRMWEHYYSLEPFGEVRADYRAASIREMVYNMAVAVESRKPVADFLLEWDAENAKPKAPQTFEEQIAIAKIMAEGMAAIHRENEGKRTD